MKFLCKLAVAALVAWSHPGFAQDPFADADKIIQKNAGTKPDKTAPPELIGIGFTAEWVEIDLRTMAGLLRKHGGDDDSSLLYEAINTLTTEGKAERVEVIYGRMLPNDRSKIESIDEMIYPTEYDPPQIPTEVPTENGAETKVPKISANPTAFETRNVGRIVEAEYIYDPDTKLIHLNLASEIVEFLGRHYHIPDGKVKGDDGVEAIWMPRFYTMKYTGHVTVESGMTTLLATFKPPREAKKDRRLMLFIHAKTLFPKPANEGERNEPHCPGHSPEPGNLRLPHRIPRSGHPETRNCESSHRDNRGRNQSRQQPDFETSG